MLKIKLFNASTVNELEVAVNYFLSSVPLKLLALQYHAAGDKHVFLLTYEVINAVEEGKVQENN